MLNSEGKHICMYVCVCVCVCVHVFLTGPEGEKNLYMNINGRDYITLL